MKTFVMATKITIASLTLSSCAASGGYALWGLASAGLYGGYWWMTRPTVEKAIDDAQVVKQPKSVPLGKSMILTTQGGIATESYNKKNKEVCFRHNTESNNYRYQLGLVQGKETAERPLAYHTNFRANILDASSHTYSYQGTETTKYKNSSGQVIATAERPVTKYNTVTTYDIEVCFPDVELVRKEDFYMVIGMDTSKNEELDDNAGFAAWHVTR